MTDTLHLALPVVEAAQAQKHVTHNEALAVLDALVMLAVIDRDLAAPPASPAEGDRYLVKAPGSGAFVGKGNQIAHYLDGAWSFYAPAAGWTGYVEDEAALIVWDGDSWQAVASGGGGGGGAITELQSLALLGVGTDADATNPFAAKLNNTLWTAKTVAEGGDGNLRYKLSKESAGKTLSFLFQDNYSGRAEIGLAGDDDFHFKVSADGSAWTDALVVDRTSGAAKINAGFFLTGDVAPSQITADQNDYNPAGLAGASVLRLSSDASRNITGLAGGGDGRIVMLVNVGANNLVLKDASASSSAGNRFSFGADLTLAPKQSAAFWYDATDSRWKLVAHGRTLGTAAALDVGTTANKIVQLDGSGRLPAVDGSQLTGISGGSGESDTQRRNQLLETTISADVRGAPITLIDRWADGYGDASGIVSGSSSNYSVDTTNKRVNLNSAFASEYKLVIHGDGADASTTFTDAATGKAVTANGNVQVDTAQSVFGGASALFDGTGDYLSLADHADWDFGSGDFTVDCRVRFASVASNRCLFMQGSAWNSNFSWGVQWVQASNLLYFYYSTDGTTQQSKTFSWTPSTNTWYHVAIVRNGNNLMAFVNGTQIGSTQSLSGVTVYNSSANLVIGAGISGLSGDHDGWLDEIAIRKGTAAWTANFTPPAAAYAGTPSNMTLVVGASLTAEAAPATMRVLLDLEPIDSITLNTDYTVEVSRDGGTTWTAGTLSQIRTIGTRYIVETNAVSVSGQPSGTSPRARLKTFNNKDVRTLGVALQWS